MPRAQKKLTNRTSRTQKPVSQEAISREAFRIFQARHGAPGDPIADWLEAERIVKSRTKTKTTPRVAQAGATAGAGARRFRSTSRRRK